MVRMGTFLFWSDMLPNPASAKEADLLAVLADELGMEVVDLTKVTQRPFNIYALDE